MNLIEIGKSLETVTERIEEKASLYVRKTTVLYRAVGRSENPGVPVVIRWV